MKAIEKIDILRDYDNHLWIHPWEHINQLGTANRPIIQKAKGIYIYDELGRKIIDGPGGMWCVQIGYGNPEMARAISKQIKKLSYSSPFFNTSEIAALAAKKVTELAPLDLKHIYFTSDGSTANDSALRFVQFYFNQLGKKQKKHIIAQGNSYHGSTHLSSSVSSKDEHCGVFDVYSERIHFLPSLLSNQEQSIISKEEFTAIKIKEFKDIIEKIGPENVAAFIAEPIQASGGVIPPPENYLRECSKYCKQNDILYISDEVVTGFGRLGHWFASQAVFDIEPDIITTAKGISSGYLPIGAFLVSHRLIENLNQNTNKLILSAGFTYSGHPAACAAVLKNIEIMESIHLLKHVQEMAPYFQEQLKQFNTLSVIKETRGMGLLAGIECQTSSDIIDKIADECLKNGLLVRHYANKIVLSPPLIINKKQIQRLFDILYESFTKIQQKYY